MGKEEKDWGRMGVSSSMVEEHLDVSLKLVDPPDNLVEQTLQEVKGQIPDRKLSPLRRICRIVFGH